MSAPPCFRQDSGRKRAVLTQDALRYAKSLCGKLNVPVFSRLFSGILAHTLSRFASMGVSLRDKCPIQHAGYRYR